MKLFWSEQTLVAQRITTAKHILLCLDFDGTLSPIAQHWDAAILPSSTKTLLEKLIVLPKLSVVIVSGRSLTDIQQHIGLDQVTYVGNHGLEWMIDGEVHTYPLPHTYITSLEKLRPQFQVLAQRYTGVEIQDKQLVLSVHYRSLSQEKLADFTIDFNELLKTLDAQSISVLPGKKVFDICPPVEWSKGHICRHLLDGIKEKINGEVLPIYIGDDTTDERAFAQLKNAVTIKVGSQTTSQAEFYIDNQTEVEKVLAWLMIIMHSPSL